jgi:hypothetical protein
LGKGEIMDDLDTKNKSMETNNINLDQGNNKPFDEYDFGAFIDYFEPNKQIPDGYETIELYSKRLKDYSYGRIDFRNLKLSGLSNSFGNKMVAAINANLDLRTDCMTAIADATQMFLKNHPVLVPNKAYNVDPAKWFIEVYERAKYICFGRPVAIDIDDNHLFKALRLENEKDRAAKLAIVTQYHNAVKSGDNTKIQNAITSLKNNWYGELLPRYVELLTEIGHKVFWTPVALEMMQVYNTYFGTIPPSDWFLYPYYSQIRSYFSRESPNMVLMMGPPMEVLKTRPYAGKIIVDIGVYLKYKAPLFSGKITFSRNGKDY